ncbi:MAG: putative signal transducing protein [Planctomycetota bacterium]
MVDRDPYPTEKEDLNVDDYQAVTHARDARQAERLRDLLLDHDIEAVVAENALDDPWAAGDGVTVLVPVDDLDEAREVLDDIDVIEELDVDDEDFDDEEDEDELDDRMQPLDAESYYDEEDEGDELEDL